MMSLYIGNDLLVVDETEQRISNCDTDFGSMYEYLAETSVLRLMNARLTEKIAKPRDTPYPFLIIIEVRKLCSRVKVGARRNTDRCAQKMLFSMEV